MLTKKANFIITNISTLYITTSTMIIILLLISILLPSNLSLSIVSASQSHNHRSSLDYGDDGQSFDKKQQQQQQHQIEEIYHRPKQRALCNLDYCDSIVSKCKLTDRCSCNWAKDAKCSKDCVDCLEEKFGKCCGCVGLCPRVLDQIHSSHVGYMNKNQTDPELFKLLTEDIDPHRRWHRMFGPSSQTIKHPITGMELEFAYRKGYKVDNDLIHLSHNSNLEKMDCIVAFINRQLSMSKCKSYCISMGASSFRWFYEGCCECVGKYCINYGIDQPHCIIDE